MKEKKQFNIPKNYDKKFEWIPGISGWEHVAFIPVAGIDYFVLMHTPLDFSNKLVIALVTVALPWTLMAVKPVRENVPMWKHLFWKLKFINRQRQFHYKKEGYVHDIQQIEVKAESRQERSEKAGASQKISTRLDSCERNRQRILDNTRQQNGSVPKSVGH